MMTGNIETWTTSKSNQKNTSNAVHKRAEKDKYPIAIIFRDDKDIVCNCEAMKIANIQNTGKMYMMSFVLNIENKMSSVKAAINKSLFCLFIPDSWLKLDFNLGSIPSHQGNNNPT